MTGLVEFNGVHPVNLYRYDTVNREPFVRTALERAITGVFPVLLRWDQVVTVNKLMIDINGDEVSGRGLEIFRAEKELPEVHILKVNRILRASDRHTLGFVEAREIDQDVSGAFLNTIERPENSLAPASFRDICNSFMELLGRTIMSRETGARFNDGTRFGFIVNSQENPNPNNASVYLKY